MDVSISSVDSGWGGHGLGEGAPNYPAPATPNPLQQGQGHSPVQVPAYPAPAATREAERETDEALIEALLAEPVDITASPLLPLNGFRCTKSLARTLRRE